MVRMDASILRVHPQGDLTIYQVEELKKELLTAFSGAEEISVDLSDTEKIDTAGFQLLVSLQKSCAETGKKFDGVGIYDAVKNFMNLYGYDLNDKKGNR
ncbi:STAS domain-containing protein [bacterium]|nr:STAS domain-containing protein [bacterium]MBU1882869.1 STAS domain-containing protein [bacterium]